MYLTLRGWAGDSGANVWGNDLLSSLQYRVNAGLVILRKYTPVKFTMIKSRAMTLSRSPQCRAFSRAVMDEKSLSPLFPVGGWGWGWEAGGQWLQMTGALHFNHLAAIVMPLSKYFYISG